MPLKPDDSFEEWLESVPDLVAAFKDSTEAFREELGSVRGFGGALTALRGRHTLAVFHRRVLGARALMNAEGRCNRKSIKGVSRKGYDGVSQICCSTTVVHQLGIFTMLITILNSRKFRSIEHLFMGASQD